MTDTTTETPERIWWNPEGHWSLHDDSAIRRSPSVEYVRRNLADAERDALLTERAKDHAEINLKADFIDATINQLAEVEAERDAAIARAEQAEDTLNLERAIAVAMDRDAKTKIAALQAERDAAIRAALDMAAHRVADQLRVDTCGPQILTEACLIIRAITVADVLAKVGAK